MRMEELEERVRKLEAIIQESPLIREHFLYNATEAAKLLRCGKTNIYDLWESGKLAVTNIGAGKKGKRVKGSDLLAFIDSQTSGGPQPKQVFKHLKSLNT